MQLTDEQIVAAFRAGGIRANIAWRQILERWRHLYRGPIVKSGGTAQDADDAMMEIAEPFQRRVADAAFEAQGRLSTYFVRCVINRWIFNQKREKRHTALSEKLATEAGAETRFADNMESEMLSGELRQLLDSVVEATVGTRCQKILGLFARGFSMTEIAVEMGFKRPNGEPNDDTAKNEKSVCQRKIRQHLLENPELMATLKSYLT